MNGLSHEMGLIDTPRFKLSSPLTVAAIYNIGSLTNFYEYCMVWLMSSSPYSLLIHS